MKGYRYILVLAIATFVFAMPNMEGTMGLIRSISADNGSAGTFNFGFYGRGFYHERIADMTGDSIGNTWAGSNSKYGAADLGLNIGYAITDWLSLNAGGIYYLEGIDYNPTDDNRASVGFGDTKVGLKFGAGGEQIKYGLYTFVSFPTGSDRNLSTLTYEKYPIFNVCYTNPGGLFRYFSSDALDYGGIALFTAKTGIMSFDLNIGYGFRNANSGGLSTNYAIYNAAVSFDVGFVTPFVELSGIDYPNADEFITFSGDNLWGPEPVYITPGLSFSPGDFNINLAADIRAIEGENTRAFPTAATDSFNITTGWGVSPPWAIIFGVSYTHDFIPEKPKLGEIAGTVTDSKTNQPLAVNLGIFQEDILIASAISDTAGLFEFTKLEPGAYNLDVKAIDYEPYNVGLLTKAGEVTPVNVALVPIPKEGVLILNIMDIETKKAVVSNVTIGNLASEKTTGRLTKTLGPGSYTIKVKAEDKNYIPYSRDVEIEAGKTLEIDVALVKKEFKIVLPQVYFEFNKSDIKPESYPVLDDAVKTINTVLSGNPDIKIEIQGHTDSVGSDAYNLKLSQSRAASVLNYIVTKHGVSPARLISRGYGESRPIAVNTTLQGRAKNRRVEFVILQ